MNDVLQVSGGEAFRDWQGDFGGLAPWQSAAAQPRMERLAFQKFGYGVDHAYFRSKVEDRQNVGMGESRHGLRLTHETREGLAIPCEALGEHLDGDVTSQARVAGAIDFAHPSSAQRRHDFIGAHLRSQ
jgi:hypothetical protein